MQLGVDVEILAVIFGVVLIAVVLWEGFETIILPRRVTRRFRMTRLFYRCTWLPWAKMVKFLVPARRQENPPPNLFDIELFGLNGACNCLFPELEYN
jgi:hypothetical protein